jgi:ribosome-associated protein
MSRDLQIHTTLTLPASELEWTSVRSSGAGGQNVNKVASKIQLWFQMGLSQVLSPEVKARLALLAGERLGADGRILIMCQETRDREKNLDLARERLAALIRKALVVPRKRKATRPSLASKRRRLDEKKKTALKKADRRRTD